MRKKRKCWEDKKLLCLYKGKSYINEKINGWKIIGYHSTKEKPSGSRVDWLCECVLCGIQKPVPAYNILSNRSKMCLSCANKDKNGEKNNNWKGIGLIPSSVLTSIKHNALSRNIPMEITGEYLNMLWESQNHKCALTGIDLVMKCKNKKDNPWSNRASLDRKDSSLGYIVGNVRWVHPIINMMKNNFDDKIFIEMCVKVSNYRKSSQTMACSADGCELVDLTN